MIHLQSVIQPIGVAIAFAAIMILSIKKMELAKVMFIACIIMALTSGLNSKEALATVLSALTDKATIELALAVFAIGLFSTTMKEFGHLERTVEGLQNLLGSAKAAIMAVPALLGTMPVLGGAGLSAPLVDRLGDSIGLSKDTKVSVNMVFRHGMSFCFPFAPGLLLASQMTGFDVVTIIKRLWPMSLLLWVTGYFVLIRPSGAAQEVAAGVTDDMAQLPQKKTRFSGLMVFVKYGSPLLLALILGLIAKWPLWLALVTGTGASFMLGMVEKNSLPALKTLFRGSNPGQVLAMFWIMTFTRFVSISPVFTDLVAKLTSKGISPPILAAILPLAFGFGSASQVSTIGVLMPILIPQSISNSTALFMVCLIYAASFVAYFASPLHLCQILTCQYFRVNIAQFYKRSWPILAGLAVGVFVYFALLLRVF